MATMMAVRRAVAGTGARLRRTTTIAGSALAHAAAGASAAPLRSSAAASLAPAVLLRPRSLSSWTPSALGARLSSALGVSNASPSSASASSPRAPFAPRPLPPLSDPASWHPHLGLFGCALKKPSDFQRMAEQCQQLCTQHVQTLLSEPPGVRTLELTDEVSNLLCSVIDVAEICKSVHPREEWRSAASDVSLSLSSFLTSLNHHAGLHAHMGALVASESFQSLSPEARRVATSLKEEMDVNGVGADDEARSEIARLLQEVQEHTNTYMAAAHGDIQTHPDDANAPPPPEYLELRVARASDALAHIPADWRPYASVQGTTVRMPLESAETLLRVLPSESLRRQVYLTHNSASLLRAQGRALEGVVRARQRLARALDAPSFADHTVGRCVAREAQHVRALLTKILDTLQTQSGDGATHEMHPKSLAEKRALQMAKLVHSDDGSGAVGRERASKLRGASSYSALSPALQAEVDSVALHPWDQSFVTSRARGALFAPSVSHALAHYFSVGNVVRGMQLLLDQVFGIEARQVDLHPQEDWTRDAQGRVQDELVKLELWEPADAHDSSAAPGLPVVGADSATGRGPMRLLGIIYLDLYARPHKFTNAASFNIRSGRQNFSTPQRPSPAAAAAGGEGAANVDADTLPRQVPVVGVITSLPRPTRRAGIHPSQPSCASGAVTLLSHGDAEMLFHELGHCLHNVLSATRFQHVAGARGELDFVEMPSTLFENFMAQPRFVAQWARHYATDAPMPPDLFEQIIAAKHAFKCSDMLSHAALALFDQRVHGPELMGGGTATAQGGKEGEGGATLLDMQRVWQQLQSNYSPWQLDSGARSADLQPFIRQAHLLSYGASYYCYLYCRVFSALVWSTHFDGAPLVSRTAGAFLRRELFAPGGAADPADILKRLARVPPQQSLQRFVEEQLPLFLHHRTATAADGTATAAASATSADVDVALPVDSGIAQQESLARAHMQAATSRPNTAA